MTREEAIYGGSGPQEDRPRSEDRVDALLIALRWRQLTEPPARRPDRYDTAKTAAFAWLYVDQYREWQRHR
jgi:hypothetical protein